jgi:hypothetical protein
MPDYPINYDAVCIDDKDYPRRYLFILKQYSDSLGTELTCISFGRLAAIRQLMAMVEGQS